MGRGLMLLLLLSLLPPDPVQNTSGTFSPARNVVKIFTTTHTLHTHVLLVLFLLKLPLVSVVAVVALFAAASPLAHTHGSQDDAHRRTMRTCQDASLAGWSVFLLVPNAAFSGFFSLFLFFCTAIVRESTGKG